MGKTLSIASCGYCVMSSTYISFVNPSFVVAQTALLFTLISISKTTTSSGGGKPVPPHTDLLSTTSFKRRWNQGIPTGSTNQPQCVQSIHQIPGNPFISSRPIGYYTNSTQVYRNRQPPSHHSRFARVYYRSLCSIALHDQLNQRSHPPPWDKASIPVRNFVIPGSQSSLGHRAGIPSLR